MSYPDESWADHQRRRWMKPNAHLYMRPDASHYLQPDQSRWNPHLAEIKRAPDLPPAYASTPAAVSDFGVSLSEILKLKSDLAAVRVQFAVIKHEIAIRRARGLPPLEESEEDWHVFLRSLDRFQKACRKAGFNPDQPRDERGRWNDGAGSDPPNKINEKPPTAQLRNSVIKEVARSLANAAAKELAGPIGTFLNLAEAASWLYEAYPYVRAYLDPPKTLDELQQAVQNPAKGYDVHHIVEQTPAELDKIPRSIINSPDNLVRIPTLKHWEITGWYMTRNKDYGAVSPREYLRGKSWDERTRVGIRALVRHGVLKP